MGKNGIPVVTGDEILRMFIDTEEEIITDTRQVIPNVRDENPLETSDEGDFAELLEDYLQPEAKGGIIADTRQAIPSVKNQDPSKTKDNDEDFEALLEKFLPPETKSQNEGYDVEDVHIEIQSKLDLHGMIKREAMRALTMFIIRSKQQKLSKVEIITGRGNHSVNGIPVLKLATEEYLKRLKKVNTVKRMEWNNRGGSVIVYL